MANLDISGVYFLIVEDNRNMRTLLKTILNSFGCRHIAEADDGADAFAVMKNFPPDIVICDWEMEPLDGVEFVRMVRTGADSPNPLVPIIMVTAYTEAARVNVARDAGINEFLGKPISANSLYNRVRAIIERPRPFIRAKSYVGPDRRRRESDGFLGAERRST